MPKIAIVTDTDSSLPLSLTRQLEITQVPIIMIFGEETLRDVYEITSTAAFTRIDEKGKLPTTSAPSPVQFEEAFKTAFESGADSILCFTVSSEVSSTYTSALSARETFADREIKIIDTRNLSIAQGMMVLAAAKAIASGSSLAQAASIAIQTGQRTRLYAALPTLKYLAMSGRVSQLVAGVAGLLSVKPILTIRNGKLDLLERVRTQKKSWERVLELSAESIGEHPIESMSIIHVTASEDAQQFEALLREKITCPDEISTYELNPGLAVHAGAGLVGVVFVIGK